jgi:hypothetical protein
MLKKLFRPKWQHTSPDVRIDAIQKLDSSNDEHRQILISLAHEDKDNDVRQQAIKRISDLNELQKLANCENPLIARFAMQRCADLISGVVDGLSDSERINALDNCSQPLLFEIAQLSAIKLIQEQAITQLTDQESLLKLATESPNSQIRCMAAVGIIEQEALKTAVKLLKNKDKGALQIVKNKLNELKKQDEAKRLTLQLQEELCQQMLSLSKSSYSPQYSSKYQHLQQQWQAIIEPDSAIKSHFDSAARQALALIEQHQEEERQRLINEESQIQQQQSQTKICDELEQLRSSINTAVAINTDASEDIQQQLADLTSRWKNITDEQAPHPREKMRYDKATREIGEYLTGAAKLIENQELLEKLKTSIASQPEQHTFSQLKQWSSQLRQTLNRINWPEQFPAPLQLTELKTLKEQLGSKLDALKVQQNQIIKTVRNELSQLEEMLESGATDAARKLQVKIRSNLDKLDGQESKSLEQQFHLLHKQVSEFEDWRQYATDPKRLSLVEEMEKLIEAPIPPQQKAQAVKQLQQEWKQLGKARNTQQIWKQFKQAADKAYAPCKIYFQQQAELRAHNLNQRRNICEQLKQFIAQTDWNNADWKAVEQIHTVAKQEWRLFTPTDRVQAKEIQQQFNTLLDELNKHLRTERQRNAEKKQQLIEQAKKLLVHEDIQEALEQAKKLQNQWQGIGITYRKNNQQLWQNFREVCDQIFERRNHEREAQQHEREENHQHALEICQRIRECAELDDSQLSESQTRIRELKDEFQALGPLPKQHYQDTKQQFQAACELFQQRLAGIGERQRYIALDKLAKCAEICTLLENTSDESQRASIQESWPEIVNLPSDWQQGIEQRYQQSLAAIASAEAKKDNETQLRQLCIRAEIMAGIDSPAEDQAQRMAYQMSRLSSGIGQARRENQDDFLELQVQWHCTGPVGNNYFPALQVRFQEAIKTAEQGK